MKNIKINLTYKFYSKRNNSSTILRNIKRYHRQIKKNLKISLKDISNTLDIYDWLIEFKIDNFMGDNDFEKNEHLIRIKTSSKINNIKGYTYFIYPEALFSTNNTRRQKFNEHITYKNNKINFNSSFFDKNISCFLVLDNFTRGESLYDFESIDNKKITYFQNKHKEFLSSLHNQKLLEFSDDEMSCGLQNFYISKDIYWKAFYPSETNPDIPKTTHVRNIKDCDESTFIRSLIEVDIIHINQDIEEVLTWDIKDIFAMSKLIGY